MYPDSPYYDLNPRAGHESRYKRPTSVPHRISDWEKWRKSMTATDEEVLKKLGRGKGCPASVDLMKLKYRPLPSQYRFHASNSKYKGFSGPIGCIAGETKLDGSHPDTTIAELTRRQIAPIVNTLLGPAQADIPYLKGRANLYQIRLTTGESMLVTLDHLFFVQQEQPWQPVRSLSVGDYILRAQPVSSPSSDLEYEPSPLTSSRDIFPSKYRPNVQHSSRRDIGWMDRYFVCRPNPPVYDEQPQSVVSNAQVQSPLPDDAHGHIRWNYSLDDPAYVPKHIHPCLFYAHPSKLNSTDQHFSCDNFRIHEWTRRPLQSLDQNLFEFLSASKIDFQSTVDELIHDFGYMQTALVCAVSSQYDYNLSWGQIEEIKFQRADNFYDISVPGAGHYISGGLVSHNSGKSMALAYESLYLSALNPNCIGYVTAPTRTMLHGAARKAIFDMLLEEGIAFDFKGGEQDTITFKRGDPNFDSTNGLLNPSQICFRTASNADRLRGPNISWFAMDEMTYSEEEAWGILVGRIRDPRANTHNGFGCWTPKGMDWVYKLFVNEETKDKNSDITYSSPRENFHLPEGFYADISAQYDEAWAKQELEGAYLNVFQGQVYHSYNQTENVQNCNYTPGLPLIWTLDFNVNPFCSVLLQRLDGPHQQAAGRSVIKPWTEIWAVDEIVLHDANTYQMCEAFRKRTESWVERNKNRIKVQMYGDATGARSQTSAFSSDWQIIRDWFVEHNHLYEIEWHVNIPGFDQNPPVRGRVNAVNAALCDSNGIRRLRIDPKCAVLLNDLQVCSWRRNDEGTTMDEGKKRELTHASDALGYYIVHDIYQASMDYMRQRLPGF